MRSGVKYLAIGVWLSVAGALIGCGEEPSQPAASGEDLWPLENGYWVALSRLNDGDPRFVCAARLVFDINLLEPAYEHWKGGDLDTWRQELREFGGSIDAGLSQYTHMSCILQKVAKHRPGGPERLVEMFFWRGHVAHFFLPERDGKHLIRKAISEEDQAQIRKYFWPLYIDGKLRDGVYPPDWKYRSSFFMARRKVVNSADSAPTKFTVVWNGREYNGVGVQNETFAVPGLGPLATGDFRPAHLAKQRQGLALCAVELIVPSKGLFLHNREMDIHLREE